MGLCIHAENKTGSAQARFSYGGFHDFRTELCQKTLNMRLRILWQDCDKYTDKPFWELLCHSDNEGTFDTEQCKKLDNDFKQHREKLQADSCFLAEYEDVAACFALGADGGSVEFH